MMTIRKHLHVRAYKKLFTSHAKTGGNHGDKCIKRNSPPQGLFIGLEENTSKEVKEISDVGNTKAGAQDERVPRIEIIESLEEKEPKNTKLLDSAAINREHKTSFSGSKFGIMIPDLESDILLEPSGEELYTHGYCEMNKESRLSTFEEHGVAAAGVCNSEFLGTTNQQIAEENLSFVPKDSTDAQTIITPMHNACLVCKQPGQLICCCGKGCKRSYHLSCFNPLLHDVPPGDWLCFFCVKKKMDLGVYSVSDGIESVWNLDEGMQSGKQYFVKYKGAAHVHNRWISESELLHDAPALLANFGKKDQKELIEWRKEWTEPERLLRKRMVSPLEVADEYTSASVSESLICFVEWFVKWKGLEYDGATWELEKSLILCSSEVPRLIKDYESRHEQASRAYDPLRAEKALQVKKDPFCKMSKLPDECSVELDNDHLSSVNFIREFWYKSLNAVLIDGQGSISKSILFVLSLQSLACRPFLIITSFSSLQQWQVNFVRLAPSMNVIMYQGNKDIRKMIQNLEFYEENGRLMFQVLLADPKAVVEDLDDIACIGWESIIVDECQNSKMIKCLEQLNTLNTDFKLLLCNGQLKDSLSEYHVLLSFLSTGGTVNNGLVGLEANSNDAPVALAKLKEKLARYFVLEGKTDKPNFLEYWVPVPLSSVQLEQYCATLLSNARVLRSNLRYEVVGALHNILITVRKCCDHPYLVAGELRGLLTKGLQGAEFMNAEVCASGKLYLLGKILQEIKVRGLRVVILFQSLGGSEKVSVGDMLDDFLQQRFGMDTYERIETGMVMANKVAALKKFNDKESGRFAFLIERRACLPSVKLRSIDAIILFNSDLNPLNDLRSLHKITVESQHNYIRVFRFYTSYTVEEKLLMLAKEAIILESTVESISCNMTQLLLGWGSSYLFQMLDKLHSIASPNYISEPSFEKLCLNDVLLEILTQLPGNTESNKTVPCSILVRARLTGGTYSRNNVLMGEKEGISLPDKDLPSFWLGLLEGRHPKWMHISENSQRIRRRNQNANGLAIQAAESDEVKSKRQKINNIVRPSILPEFLKEKGDAFKDIHETCMLESDGGERKLDDQRNLPMLRGSELSELCDNLGLPESSTNKHTRPVGALTSGNNQDMYSSHVIAIPASDSAVTLSPHSEMSCNNEAPSNSTNCTLPLVEQEQEILTLAGCQEVTLHLHHSVEPSELLSQEESMALVVESEPSNHQIPENSMHPERSQESPSSEGIPSEHLRSSATQYGLAFDWSHSSSQQVDVSVQDVIEAAIFESEPFNHQIPENNLNPMRLQEDPPLERACLEHVGSTGIQPDEPYQFIHNFPSIEWVPPQAISADPIHNEIVRFQQQVYLCTKKHENKKLLFQLECEQEIEKIRRKYDILMQDTVKECLHEKKMFLKTYQKIIWHYVFAAEIRSKFYDHMEGSLAPFQDSSQNFNQHLHASQPQQLSSSNTVRRPIHPRANLYPGRSPAPHLQRFRPARAPPTSAANPQPATPTLVLTSTPSVPPSILVPKSSSPFMESHIYNAYGISQPAGSILVPNSASPFMESDISNAYGISQPAGSNSQPLDLCPFQFELPLYAGSDDLLESMLANLPATDNAFRTGTMADLRPNASSDVFYLSDEE